MAREQVDEAMAVIAAERPQAALRWLESLLHQARSLADFPERGRVVPELQRREIRELLVHPYRVLYRREGDEVVVLALHHDRRLLGDEHLVGQEGTPETPGR
jgi:plasmid stabilization system protein ParE